MQYDDWGVRSQRWKGIRSETVTVSGSRVHLLRADGTASSDAPTQLMLHGLGAGGSFLLDLIGPLTAYGPVVAPDLPGSIFGQTDTPNHRAARIENNARFVEALVAELSIETAVVHGWSMGAAIAIRFAAESPKRVAGLVLANPPIPAPLGLIGRFGWKTLGRLTLAVAPIVVRGLTRVVGRRTIETKLAYLGGDSMPSSLTPLGGDLTRIPQDTLAVWTEQLAEVKDHPETMGYAATSFASVVSAIFVDQTSTRGAIDRVDAPVLVLWGDQDPLVERPSLDDLLVRRPDWDLYVFEGAGHAAPAERPDEYMYAVTRWLAATDEVPGRRGGSQPRHPEIEP